nr:hypothetical protein [Bird parvovirus]
MLALSCILLCIVGLTHCTDLTIRLMRILFQLPRPRRLPPPRPILVLLDHLAYLLIIVSSQGAVAQQPFFLYPDDLFRPPRQDNRSRRALESLWWNLSPRPDHSAHQP